MTPPASQTQLVISGAHLINPYVGVGVYTLRLLRGLARADRISFKLLVPASAPEIMAQLPPGCGVRVPGAVSSKVPEIGRSLYWMDRIAAMAGRDYPEAIFHSPGSFWSFRRPAKTVVTLHDCIYRKYPFYLGRYPFRPWMAQASERYAAGSGLIITVSQSAATDLRDLAHIPAAKLKVIYQWVEDRFNAESARREIASIREKYQLPPSLILYVGGYDYRKNVEFLIRAYAQARDRASLPPLVLAGKIPHRLERTLCDIRGEIARAGLKEGADIFLPGLIDDGDMPGLYAAASLLVYPSLYEGFGYPPIEAIACGTPALAADNSSLREVVLESRNRFSTDNSGDLATLIIQAAHCPDDFRTSLRPEFTEARAIDSYLAALASAFPGRA